MKNFVQNSNVTILQRGLNNSQFFYLIYNELGGLFVINQIWSGCASKHKRSSSLNVPQSVYFVGFYSIPE